MTETPSQDPLAQTPGYRLEETPATPAAFVALRKAAGMGSRSLEAAERGLPNSVYAVHVVHEDSYGLVSLFTGECRDVAGTHR